MKKRITSEFSFEVWVNNDIDSMTDDVDSLDDNWLVSAGDLFEGVELPTDEPLSFYDEAA